MSVTAALIVGSTVMKMYSDSKARAAEAAAARAQAEAKRKQALELLERSEINIGKLKEEGERFGATQVLSAAAQGFADIPLAQLEDTWDKINEEVNFQRREAQFKADQLRSGADIDMQLAGDIQKAGKYETASTLLGGAERYYKATE